MSNLPAFILVRPQMPENIGMAARAMGNFGLTDLRLVEPRELWPSLEAERNAAGALEGVVNVQVFDTLPEALSDLHLTFAATARARDMNKDVFGPEEVSAQIQAAQDLKTGIVFGPERTGLTNEDLKYCRHILTYPVNPQFFSLNIAQAVLLMAYELGRNLQILPPAPALEPAPQAALENFFIRLETLLEEKGFYKAPHLKESIQRNTRTMLMRADFTENELSTLQGILSALADVRKS
ncbi:MAG: RNA methyltransferase [Alphaproteobacteria bacterium]|nr:RNA methyltransferase [Alphaproteobacteria bacterium]